MISVPLHSQMAKMTQKEIGAWLLSLLWGGCVRYFYSLVLCSLLFEANKKK